MTNQNVQTNRHGNYKWILRKCNNHEAQPSRGTKSRKDEEQIITKQTPQIKPPMHHKDELQQRNRICTKQNDQPNATCETTDEQTKNNYNRRTTFERSVGKLLGDLNQFYPLETSPLVLTPVQITNICPVRIGALYLIYETSPWNTYNRKPYEEKSKVFTGDMKPEHKRTTNRTTISPTTKVFLFVKKYQKL